MTQCCYSKIGDKKMIKVDLTNSTIKIRKPPKISITDIIEKYPHNTGWIKPIKINNAIKGIISNAQNINKEVDYLLVIGVGGSINGTRACLSMLNKDKKIIFVGETFDEDEILAIKNILLSKKFAINVISKSGLTKETLIAFELFEKLLKAKTKEYKKLIFVTTGKNSPLDKYALMQGYTIFYINDDIGGRFSTLTAVGLFPMAFAKVDIKNVIMGANEQLETSLINNNDCLNYALARYKLYKKNKTVELISTFNIRLYNFTLIAEQLLAESLGKNGGGILPKKILYTRDLHSVGQYIEEGKKQIFETFLLIKNQASIIKLNEVSNKSIDYLNGKSLSQINEYAYQSVIKAHKKALVPTITLIIDDISAYSFGSMYMFFCLSSALGGLIAKANPFNQDGVNSYKTNLDNFLQSNNNHFN